MGFRIETEPAAEPITLEEAKSHLRVTHDDEDAIIRIYLVSARRWVEEYLHRALIDQVWEITLDDFPLEITLPLGRISAVASIKYFDSSGIEQTLRGPTSGSPAGTDYQEDLTSDEQARISPPITSDWPQAQAHRLAAVTVQFTAGYGTKGSDLPASLLTGLLYRLTDLYEFRGATDGAGTASAKLEIQQYRLREW